ncbi:VapE domain-containing protein [Chamaesiphon sp. GL140_3_metabinner_50]|uniref:VapE domain-containing protein n=1 Tax=Chamaesiphon sp. GL140_3_metabinner_50 TaxID=2970812 RepID=UPI0025CE9958|nr:VapE domain-containing protein [Chamaesiphon sp. GL140_3_metabinner_50]
MTYQDLRGIMNDTLKSLHPQTEEYRLIVRASGSIGLNISMVGSFQSGGDKSQQDDPKESQDGETKAETLYRVIRYTLFNSQIERDVMLFDCWSANNYLQMRSLKNNKADLEKLRGKVIVNLDECDSAFQGLAADDLKEVVTAKTDNYRAPYERNAADRPRSAILFGTTNKVELIQDMDGDRRFFPVRVRKAIDIQWVADNWSDFWGFYKYCYLQSLGGKSIYRNWTSKAEEALLVKLQADYKANAPWMETLEGVLDILEDACGGKLCLAASDLLAVLSKETGGTKNYMSGSIKSKMVTERGYQEGRPKLADGTQPGKPRLFLGKSPKNISRDAIGIAYQKYLSGEYQPKTRQVEAEPMATVKAGSEFPVYQQLDSWNTLEKATKDKEHNQHCS